MLALSSGAWGAIAAIGAALTTALFGLLTHLMNAVRKENTEQHAASQAEMKNIVVGLARVEGSLTAHIASPHIGMVPAQSVLNEVPHGS